MAVGHPTHVKQKQKFGDESCIKAGTNYWGLTCIGELEIVLLLELLFTPEYHFMDSVLHDNN